MKLQIVFVCLFISNLSFAKDKCSHFFESRTFVVDSISSLALFTKPLQKLTKKQKILRQTYLFKERFFRLNLDQQKNENFDLYQQQLEKYLKHLKKLIQQNPDAPALDLHFTLVGFHSKKYPGVKTFRDLIPVLVADAENRLKESRVDPWWYSNFIFDSMLLQHALTNHKLINTGASDPILDRYNIERTQEIYQMYKYFVKQLFLLGEFPLLTYGLGDSLQTFTLTNHLGIHFIEISDKLTLSYDGLIASNMRFLIHDASHSKRYMYLKSPEDVLSTPTSKYHLSNSVLRRENIKTAISLYRKNLLLAIEKLQKVEQKKFDAMWMGFFHESVKAKGIQYYRVVIEAVINNRDVHQMILPLELAKQTHQGFPSSVYHFIYYEFPNNPLAKMTPNFQARADVLSDFYTNTFIPTINEAVTKTQQELANQ